MFYGAQLIGIENVGKRLEIARCCIGDVPGIVIHEFGHAGDIGRSRQNPGSECSIQTIGKHQRFSGREVRSTGDQAVPPGIVHREAIVAGAVGVWMYLRRAAVRIEFDGLTSLAQQRAAAGLHAINDEIDAHGNFPEADGRVDVGAERRVARLGDVELRVARVSAVNADVQERHPGLFQV